MADNIDNDSANATILAAEEASVAVNNENYAQMILSGWTQITDVSLPQDAATNHYVGAAFYKVIDGVTEVIIANQGSENLYDFAVSDTQLALNGTPACDPDALAYYNAVVAWANNAANTGNTGGSVNVIETGHSLGGQEADYVEAFVADGNQPTVANVTTEAISFDAPGQSTSMDLSGVTYNALNISLVTDGVHIAGSSLNAGYLGGSVTINGGVNGAVVGVAAAAICPVAGILGWFLTSFVYDHVTTQLTNYFNTKPALGGVNLQTYSASDLNNQSFINALGAITASNYDNSTDPAGLIAGVYAATTTSAPATSSTAETFTTSSSSATGFTLQGSNGDTITASISGTQETVTVTGANGQTEGAVLTFNVAGTELVSDSTTQGDPTTSTTSFAPDGSSTTTTTYDSGAYATTTNDGQGNITTDYFTKNGVETSSTWVHSDGTSGTVDVYQDGLTRLPGAGTLPVPESGTFIIQNPEGSYATTGGNASDTETTTSFDASGTQTGQSSAAGAGVNNLTVASSSTVYSAGAEYTNQYNSAGTFIGDTWYSANPDGSVNPTGIDVAWANNAICTSGTEVANASGVVVKNDTALDGSSYRDTIEQNGNTVSHYNAQGVLLSDQWSDTDGSNTTASVTGSDTFNTDGSGSGTFTDTRDGTSGTVTLSAQGQIIVSNASANGTTTSTDTWNGDGTYTIEMFNADGSVQATYDYLANGNVTVTDMAADGSIADQQTVAAGLVVNPDGSDFSKVANADGSYTVYYEDAQGDTTAYQYSVKPKRPRCALRRSQHVRHALHRAGRIKRAMIK